MFVTIEGMDCSGKSSVIIPYIMSKLDPRKSMNVADLRSSPIASKIRNIFMDPSLINNGNRTHEDWVIIGMLASVARADMVLNEINPALLKGNVVICDRYVDTSFVYNQCSDKEDISKILDIGTLGLLPDFVIFSYCSYEEMISRKSNRSDNDVWDLVTKEAYEYIFNRYVDRLKSENRDFIMLDTSGTLEEVYNKLDYIIDGKLNTYKILP